MAFIEGGWPRALVNDKPFLADWPFLAEPYPDSAEAAPPSRSIWPYIIEIVILFALVNWGVVEIIRRLMVAVVAMAPEASSGRVSARTGWLFSSRRLLVLPEALR